MNEDQRKNLIKLIKWISDPLEFRKLVKVSDEHKGAIPYEPWEHLLRLVYLKRKHRYVVVGKAKKQGVSTEFGIDALNLAMTRPGWRHRFISKGEAEGVRQLLDPAKFAYMHFPKEIQELVVPDKWNDTEIRFPLLNSSIIVLSGTSTGAVGEAASEVDIDEMDFQEDPHRAWVTAEAATMYGGRACLSSTRWIADTQQSEWLQIYLGAMEGANNFKKIFISCFSRPTEDAEEWRENQRKNYASSESGLFEWNYPRTEEDILKQVGSVSFFNLDVLNNYMAQAREPMETKYGFCHIFSKFDTKVAYGAGADISQGLGQDSHALVVLAKQGSIYTDAAYIDVDDISLDTYARYTYDFCSEYNFPLLIGESNSMGLNYLQKLQELRYPRLFKRGEGKDIVGWYTQDKNKEMALIDLQQAIDNGSVVIRYKPLLSQLMTFHRIPNKDGVMRIKSSGKHDDLVMGLALAYQAAKSANPPISQKFQSLVTVARGTGMFG